MFMGFTHGTTRGFLVLMFVETIDLSKIHVSAPLYCLRHFVLFFIKFLDQLLILRMRADPIPNNLIAVLDADGPIRFADSYRINGLD